MPNHQVNQSELRERILLDLGSQNVISLVVYPVVWGLLALQAELMARAPVFFWANLPVLVLTTVMRLYVHSRMRTDLAKSAPFLERVLIVTVLFNALHWSGMTLWSLLDPRMEPIRIAMLMIVTGMTGSGTFAVALLTPLRIFFPTILLVPPGVAMLLSSDPVESTLGALSIAFLGYVLPSAYRRQQDYISAVSTALLLEQRTKELEQISFTDTVTGLNNRTYFDAHFELEWKRAHRLQYPLSLLLIDLDHFKFINDAYGHPAGDRCLAAIGACLANSRRRAGDILARMGGDEFAILLVNADQEAAGKIATALCQSVRNLSLVEQGQQLPLTSSIGISTTIPSQGEPSETASFIASADGALYAAKGLGRDQWQQSSLPAMEPQ